jgi:hypothetical protein
MGNNIKNLTPAENILPKLASNSEHNGKYHNLKYFVGGKSFKNTFRNHMFTKSSIEKPLLLFKNSSAEATS